MHWLLCLALMAVPADPAGSTHDHQRPLLETVGGGADSLASSIPAGLRAAGCRFAGSSCAGPGSVRPIPAPSGEALRAVSSVQTPVATESMVLGGGLGWVAGLAAGFGIGYLAESDAGEGYFGPGEWWLGAALGSSIGTAVGVHIADRAQGNLALTSLAALTGLPVGALLAVPLLEVGGFGVLAIPAAQIGAAIVVERLTRGGARPGPDSR